MKVLLITHNPISTNNNMGKTFLTLFSQFERDELCQLYVHPSIPDVDICRSCFQITDKQVLQSYFGRSPGGEITIDQINEQIKLQENARVSLVTPWRGVDHVSCLLRDAMWRMSHWYTKRLKAWLYREKPTCIFLAPGYAKFIYDIALKISKDYDLPIVTYICDDYYFVKRPRDILGRMFWSALQKKTRQLMKKNKRLVVISQEIKEAYYSHFSVTTEVVMTGASLPCGMGGMMFEKVKNISYFGNLSVGRYLSLAHIGRVLDDINSSFGTHVNLNIYTNETSLERLNVFNNIASVKLCGFVSGKEFEEAFVSSDILVHTESFEQTDMDLVKHSISTKIADSLASGIPVLAYGPENISSMKHLIRNECALIATSREMLKPLLEKALTQSDERARVAQNALATAAEYHDKQRNSARLRSIFVEIGGQSDE